MRIPCVPNFSGNARLLKMFTPFDRFRTTELTIAAVARTLHELKDEVLRKRELR